MLANLRVVTEGQCDSSMNLNEPDHFDHKSLVRSAECLKYKSNLIMEVNIHVLLHILYTVLFLQNDIIEKLLSSILIPSPT